MKINEDETRCNTLSNYLNARTAPPRISRARHDDCKPSRKVRARPAVALQLMFMYCERKDLHSTVHHTKGKMRRVAGHVPQRHMSRQFETPTLPYQLHQLTILSSLHSGCVASFGLVSSENLNQNNMEERTVNHTTLAKDIPIYII